MTNLTKKTLLAVALVGSAQLAFADSATTVRTIVQSEEAVTTALKLINENPAKAWSVITGNTALNAAATAAGITSSKDLLKKLTLKNTDAVNFVRQNAPALIGSQESAKIADAAVANPGEMLKFKGGAPQQASEFQMLRTFGALKVDPRLNAGIKEENVRKQFGPDLWDCFEKGSFTAGSKASEVVAAGVTTALENRANTAAQLNELVVSAIDRAQESILGQTDAQDRAARAEDALFGKNEGCHLFNKL